MPAGPVAFLLKGYPRLSETFIAQEIRGLEKAGLDIRIYSLRHPYDPATHPVHDEIEAPVAYLPEYLKDAPLRVLRGWWRAHRLPGYRAAKAAYRRDLARDRTANRRRRWGQALVLAAEAPDEIVRFHAHFLHTPASVARYAAIMRGLPWSCSAHAKDIWTTPEWEKREKLASLDWLVTCTRYGARHLATLADDPDKVALVYHGLDLDRFAAPGAPHSDRDGGDARDPVRLLSVGRAVEKKGFDTLLDALAALPAGLHWRWIHIGGGELREQLQTQAGRLGLSGRIEWRGAQSQAAVLAAYREADIFVLPSRVAADGDRDGLPNVLMEAQSQALPVVSTPVSGIPELVEDGKTGILVPPDDAPALSGALKTLIAGANRRKQLGKAGAARIRREFSHEAGIAALAVKFGLGRGEARAAE